MSADKKKSVVKFYAVLLIICFTIIAIIFVVDILIISTEDIWFEYVKNIFFGIFTGIITGSAISFYEYRKQIYSDFYIFIKQTSDFIKILEKMISSKNYDLCTVQVEAYKNLTKSRFALRKLRKNNKLIIEALHLMYSEIDVLYENLNGAYKTSNSITLYEKQILKLYQLLLDRCDEPMSEVERIQSFQKLSQEKSIIDKSLKILEESIEVCTEDCKKQLQTLESQNLKLYTLVNKSQSLFIL